MKDGFDAVVLGAGVVGGAVAYFLSKEGLKVCLMDRESLGSGASAHGHGALSMVGRDFKPGAHFDLGLEGMRFFPGFVQGLIEDSGVDPMYHEMPGVNVAMLEEERAYL